MEYAKHLLSTYRIDLGNLGSIVDMFESLSNQREVTKITKKLLAPLTLTGNLSIIRCGQDEKFSIVDHVGDLRAIEGAIKNKSFLFSQKDSRKPYFYETAKNKEEGFFILLPILSKMDLLGFFCIHQPQPSIDCWKDIYLLIQAMSFIFKYYDMVETSKEAAIIDVVTGLYNSRHFKFQIDLEIGKARRNHIPLTLMLIEVEGFNEYNKTLGFEAGEDILRQVGRRIKRHSRGSDMPSKLYDDKFAILLYDSTLEGAQGFAQRLDHVFSEIPLTVNDQAIHPVLRYAFVEHEHEMSGEEFYELAKIRLKKD